MNLKKLSTLPVTTDVAMDIRHILSEARQITVKAVNSTMVAAYWLIVLILTLKNATQCVAN